MNSDAGISKNLERLSRFLLEQLAVLHNLAIVVLLTPKPVARSFFFKPLLIRDISMDFAIFIIYS
tara:strand:+ start:370 stop:564 length:195 start_codon:yes stop_codon:yes gene_type:complete